MSRPACVVARPVDAVGCRRDAAGARRLELWRAESAARGQSFRSAAPGWPGPTREYTGSIRPQSYAARREAPR